MKNKSRKTSKKINARRNKSNKNLKVINARRNKSKKMFKGGSPITIDGKQYTIGKQIGKGGYSSVYLATDQEDKKYALKIVKPKPDNDFSVENEMNILNKLKEVCDEFILCVTGYEKKGNFHYIVTEYLDGYIDMFDYIVGYDYPTDEQKDDKLIKIIDNLCKGLLKIHQQDVAHRDIKPENIMIHPETLEIKYIDFGLSCYNKSRNYYCRNPNIGSSTYIYPRLNTTPTTPTFKELQKSDIWSLGITIFVLISTSYPFYYIDGYKGNDDTYILNLMKKFIPFVEDIKVKLSQNKELNELEAIFYKNMIYAKQLYKKGGDKGYESIDLDMVFSK